MNGTITEQRQDTGYALRQQLGFKVSRVARLMQQRLDADLAREGLTRLSWCVLTSVGLEGIRTPSGVAANLGVTRPMLSRLIKSMSTDGLLHSALASGDGRHRELSLTEHGQRTLARCLPLVQHNMAHFSSKLSTEGLEHLHGLIDTLLEGEDAKVDSV